MERLPDELLFLIVRELDTARDVAHLGTCSRRLHRLVAAEGWRIFVQTRFPHRDYATADAWAWLAERLTYNARCWDRRSIIYDLIDVARTDVYHDVAGGMVRGEASGSAMARGRQRQGQTAAYQPIVDVGIDRSTGEQLVVWGAGENLVASRRPSSWTYRVKARPGSRGASEVAVSPGASFGYRPGVDDITGLVLCGKDDAGSGVPRYVAVGRASGDISLHSTEGSLAVVHRLSTGREEEEEAEEDESGERSEVRSLDSCGQMVAAGMREGAMFLYKLPGSDAPFVMQPTLQLSMEHDGQEMPRRQEYASIRCVKFVREDILAVGLIGQVSPLRYIRMAESRAVTEFAPRDNALSFYGPASTVKAIEPLCPSDSKLGNLVLSAWDDGTIRLKDLRTPSPYDTVYQDDWQPYRPANALLAYGTDHFISGCSVQSALKFFDLRWHRGPASYRHTSALACVDTKPYPAPLAYRETAESQALPNGTRTSARCDHVRGLRCTWHALSVLDYYRPSYTAIVRVYGSMGGGLRGPADQNWRRRPLEAAVPDVSTARQRRGASRRAAEEHTSVYSLAHSSTFAPDFFVGVAGGVVVGRLRETGPGGPTAADDEPLDAWPPPQLTPSLPSPPPVQLAAATTPPDATLGSRHEQRLHVTILETGLGLVDPRATHADLVRTRVPRLLNAGQGFGIDMAGPTDTNLEKARRAWEAHHRLDRRFHSPDDLIEAPVELFIDRDHDQDDSSRQLSDRDGSQDDQDYF